MQAPNKEVWELREQCAAAESRSRPNMFAVLALEYAKKLGLHKPMEVARKPAAKGATTKKAKK